jgi:A/G-specific adenine glycosylase
LNLGLLPWVPRAGSATLTRTCPRGPPAGAATPTATPKQPTVRAGALDPSEARRVRRRLVAWFQAHGRDLPWRRTTDPWAVLVSEVLLQQTRVEVGAQAFARLLARFPTPAAMALATEDEVLAAWAGLGYYRRARNLHAASKALVQHHGGEVPRDAQALAALPGVGPYTVEAVRAFAFDAPAAPLDANLLRVLARLTGEEGNVALPATRGRLAAVARALLAEAPRTVAGALMDLGSAVCTAAEARCDACPLASVCAARAQGTQDRIPVKAAKAAPRKERWAFARVVHQGAVLLERRGPGLLEGFWAFPGSHLGKGVLAPQALEERLATLGIQAQIGASEAKGRWVFSHRVWAFQVHPGKVRSRRAPAEGAAWFPPEALEGLPVAQPHRAFLPMPPGQAPRTL